jgi:hypothetical protein
MAIASIFVRPLLTALKTATRSAQRVRPREEFSTLHPRIILPPLSTAAPTRKLELGQYATLAASRAAPSNRLQCRSIFESLAVGVLLRFARSLDRLGKLIRRLHGPQIGRIGLRRRRRRRKNRYRFRHSIRRTRDRLILRLSVFIITITHIGNFFASNFSAR